jgi:hypothetical protein
VTLDPRIPIRNLKAGVGARRRAQPQLLDRMRNCTSLSSRLRWLALRPGRFNHALNVEPPHGVTLYLAQIFAREPEWVIHTTNDHACSPPTPLKRAPKMEALSGSYACKAGQSQGGIIWNRASWPTPRVIALGSGW